MAGQPLQRPERKQLPALTGVRAFAALLVLALHADQNFPQFISNNFLVHHGYLGVDLFFVLSGFIIAHVYIDQFVAPSAKTLRVFLWHRFVRLFPAHATVLLGLVVLIVVGRLAGVSFNAQREWDFRDLPWHFLMLHAWGTTQVAGWNAPSWSISAEWFAYLLFPAISAATLALPRHMAAPLAFAILAITALVFGLKGWAIIGAWLGTPALLRVASEFACGVLLYRATRIDEKGLSPQLSDWLALVGILGLCAAAALSVNDFVLIAFLAVLITGVSGPGVYVASVFGCRPAVWLGEISYSIYLVHFPVLLVLRHAAERVSDERLLKSESVEVSMFLFSFGVVIGAASLLFYLVEHPARKRLRNLLGTMDKQRLERQLIETKEHV